MDKNKAGLVVIFAGTRGLGAAISRIFLQNGCEVVIVGRKEESFNKFCKTLSSKLVKNIKLFINQDLDNKNSIEQIIETFKQRQIKPNTLIYNYGGVVETRNIHDSYEDWLLCIWKNVGFSSQMNAAILNEVTLRSKIKKIIHVSSASAKHLMGAQTYATSKALLNSYVITSGRQLASKGIVQMAVSPGAINTKDGPWENKADAVREDFLAHYQFSGMLGDECVIAELIFNLNGRAGDFCHGNIIDCTGGGI